jgi:hypothetical protein
MPKASKGPRTAGLVGITPNTTEVVAVAEAEHVAALVPSPRIKPGAPDQVLALSAAPAPVSVAYELVTATKAPAPEEETLIEQGDIKGFRGQQSERCVPAADPDGKPAIAERREFFLKSCHKWTAGKGSAIQHLLYGRVNLIFQQIVLRSKVEEWDLHRRLLKDVSTPWQEYA